jgi:hypothetical protein
MADEDKTEEEVVEETEAIDSAIKDGDETEAEEEETEALDAIKEFDKKIDSDDDDSAVEDGDDDDSTEEEVEKEVEEEVTASDSMEASVDALEEELKTEAAKSDEQKATDKAAKEAKATEEAEEAEAKKEDPYDCGLSTEGEDSYEPKLVETLNKQGQAMLDRATKAEANNDKLLNLIDQQSAQRTLDWLDTKFDALGEDFDEAIGKGEYDELEPGSDQQANRRKISNRMAVTVRAFVNADKPIPHRNKLFAMAVKNVFKKETNKSKTEAETKTKVKKRAGQVLGTGSKKASTVTTDAGAMKGIKDFDKKLDAID